MTTKGVVEIDVFIRMILTPRIRSHAIDLAVIPPTMLMDAYDIATAAPAVDTSWIRSLQVVSEDFEIPGVRSRIAARLHRRAHEGDDTKSLPVVLYFHGGGFVGGSPDDADVPARYIACHCPAVVVAVGYSLAPGSPFPAALEDAHAAARWAAHWSGGTGEKLRRIGVQTRSLAVVGDDAGGNLAACLSLMARDRNGPLITAQVLIGPMLDPSMTRVAEAISADQDASARACAACYRQYLPSPAQRLHPYAAPLESRRLRGLPAALIATAEHDLLHAEAEKYAAALIGAGVHTQVARHTGVTHADLPRHAPALAEVADFLRRHLAVREHATPQQATPQQAVPPLPLKETP